MSNFQGKSKEWLCIIHIYICIYFFLIFFLSIFVSSLKISCDSWFRVVYCVELILKQTLVRVINLGLYPKSGKDWSFGGSGGWQRSLITEKALPSMIDHFKWVHDAPFAIIIPF